MKCILKNYNRDNFQLTLTNNKWFPNSVDVNLLANTLVYGLISHLDDMCAIIEFITQSNCDGNPWMDREVMDAIKARGKTYIAVIITNGLNTETPEI